MDKESQISLGPIISSAGKDDHRPTPYDIVAFLPWACRQLNLKDEIHMTRIQQNEYVSLQIESSKSKAKSRAKVHSPLEVPSAHKSSFRRSLFGEPVRKIKAICTGDHLVHLKFENNSLIPRVILRIIGLIIRFHMHLHAITINRGMDRYTIYELSKFLPNSNITELYLDGAVTSEGNYYILLDAITPLKILSLSRCQIDDLVAETIANKLLYPLPAAHGLSVLNLSCNRITDEGAKCIGRMLRSNRQLSYLNLASNMITDEGARAIFDSLQRFLLTYDEIIAAKKRFLCYLKERNELVEQYVVELRANAAEDSDRKLAKKKARPGSTKKGKLEKEDSFKSLAYEADAQIYKKAFAMAQSAFGEFLDPFCNTETYSKNGLLYSNGNNTLCYISVAYNSIGHLTLSKVLAVLKYQKLMNRTPRGLVNLALEGNPMPVGCDKLSYIDYYLDIGFMMLERRQSMMKKRRMSKNKL